MERGLLIAEKPSAAAAIKAVYEKIKPGLPYQLDIASFRGHLLELAAPEDYDGAWGDRKNTSVLPMIPKEFHYQLKEPALVAGLLGKIHSGTEYRFLVNACDAGREGEHIFWSFYETTGQVLPVKRFWASSTAQLAIEKALRNLQDASVYEGLRQASKYRAQFDWLVGMNLTRAASASLRQFVGIGRVQTPTLKLVVEREKEVQNFCPEDFWEVKATFGINGAEGDFIHLFAPDRKSSRTGQMDEAKRVLADVKAAKEGLVVGVKDEVKETLAPPLYSLVELQKAANKALKFSPDRTLELVQGLYERGYLSYPRTESRNLPTDMIPELSSYLRPLTGVPELAAYAQSIGQKEIDRMLKGGYVNDGKVTDHHAIIPTDQTPNWDELSSDEKKIYLLIGKAFLAIFMPPYQVARSTVLVQVGTHIFRCQGSKELDKGYSVLYSTSLASKGEAPACKKGDKAEFRTGKVSKGTTTPPARYTPGTLLAAMQNAGQNLSSKEMRSAMRDAGGLGTSATRADILKKLLSRDLIRLERNTYYASDKAIRMMDVLGDRSFTSPALTAEWERKLHAVEDGTFAGDFRAEMEAYIRKETDYLLSAVTPAKAVVGTCPKCGKSLIDIGWGIVCEDRRSDDPTSCSVVIPKKVAECVFSEEDISALLKGERIGPKKVKTKRGEGEAFFVLTDEGVRFSPESGLASRVQVGACPLCQNAVLSGANSWFCSGKECDWSFPKVIKGTTLSDEDAAALLRGEKTQPLTFLWSSGRMGTAQLYLEHSVLKWCF